MNADKKEKKRLEHYVEGVLSASTAAVSGAFPAASCRRVHLLLALLLELVVQHTSCSTMLALHAPLICAQCSALGQNRSLFSRRGNLLRTSYPNWGYSRHSALNSASASERSVCDRVAQKLAMGARTVVSSVPV